MLRLERPFTWTASQKGCVPWRRPGAGRFVQGIGALVALGWMECEGVVGHRDFWLLKRNGGAQRERTSSSRLCKLDGASGTIEELAKFPFADSFEHNGEVYPMGDSICCVGR